MLIVCSFVTRAAYMYRDGMPDPDSVMIAAGVALGATAHMPFTETFLYGKQLNPGVFLFMRAVYHLLWTDPRNIATTLNWISVVCGTFTLLPLYDLFRVHLSARVAILCLMIWAFTPLVWEAQTSFHPVIPATMFLLIALAFARRACSREAWWFPLAGACVFAAAALMTRTEVVFVLPAILILPLLAAKKRRAFAVLLACLCFAGASYLFVIHKTAGEMATGARSMGHFWNRYREMYGMSFSLRGIPRSAAWASMGLGLGTVIGCLAGFGAFPRRRRHVWLLALCGILWALPSLIFWVPYIVPIVRHYYLSSVGLTWLLGLLLLNALPKHRALSVAVVVAAAGLLVPDAAYRAYNAMHSTTPKSPNGAFFYHHEFAERDLKRFISIRDDVLRCGQVPDGRTGAIVLCRWDVYAHVVYGIASRGSDVVLLDKKAIRPEVGYAHFSSAASDVQLISYLYMEDGGVRDAVSDVLMDAWREGNCVFVPGVIRPFASLSGLPRVRQY